MHLIINFLSFFITLPFLAFFIVYYLAMWINKDKKRATTIAINVTTICLFLSVSIMFQVIGQFRSGVFISILILLVFWVLIISLQWNLKKQVDINKSIKSAFRLWFVALSICYILLFFISIVRNFI